MMKESLLHLPPELLLRISEYTTFADLWYLATCSRYCRKIAYKLICHRYQIDLSKKQLNTFDRIIYAALAYVSRHGYQQNSSLDHSAIQSVCNRLAVEIYDKSPSKNWEYCLDFYLDKTLGLAIDHVMLDTLLDTVPKHAAIINNNVKNKQVLMSEFYPTKMGKLISTFLTTFHSTLLGLFETEPTTEIYHRLLLNHLNRHMDSMALQYRHTTSLAVLPKTAVQEQHHHQLRLNVRILVRLIGTLVQADLISVSDLEIITRQRIIHSLFGSGQKKDHHVKKKPRHTVEEDIEFQMEIFLDLSRAILLLEQKDSRTAGFSSLLNDTVSTLISTKSNEHHFISSSNN